MVFVDLVFLVDFVDFVVSVVFPVSVFEHFFEKIGPSGHSSDLNIRTVDLFSLLCSLVVNGAVQHGSKF